MAATTIGKLVVSLTMDSSRFTKSINRATGKIKAFDKGLTRTGLLMTGLGLAMQTPMIFATRSFAKYGDSIAKLANRTGMTTKEVSELAHVADLGGASMEAFERGIRGMQRGMFDAARGAGELKDAMEFLGLNWKELDKLNPAQQFSVIADRLVMVKNASVRSGIAMKIFARAGSQLIPMLRLGSEGIAKYRKEAERLGISIDEKTAKAAERLIDMIERQKAAWQGLVNSVGKALFPMYDKLLVVTTNLTTNISNFINQRPELVKYFFDLSKWLLIVGASFIALAGTIKTFRSLVTPNVLVGAAILALIVWSGALDDTLKHWKAFVMNIQIGGKSIREWMKNLSEIWIGLAPAWESGLKALGATLDWFFASIQAGFNRLKKSIIADIGSLFQDIAAALVKETVTIQREWSLGYRNVIKETKVSTFGPKSILAGEVMTVLSDIGSALVSIGVDAHNTEEALDKSIVSAANRMAEAWKNASMTAKSGIKEVAKTAETVWTDFQGSDLSKNIKDAYDAITKDFEEFTLPGFEPGEEVAELIDRLSSLTLPAALERGSLGAASAEAQAKFRGFEESMNANIAENLKESKARNKLLEDIKANTTREGEPEAILVGI